MLKSKSTLRYPPVNFTPTLKMISVESLQTAGPGCIHFEKMLYSGGILWKV